jgi:hypothetical protein
MKSTLVDLAELPLDILRSSRDAVLTYTTELLTGSIERAPCLLQNQRASNA